MFGRMMNNYYYGKSGKGDFRREDLPSNRWQLFRDTLKTRFSALFRINLLYMLIFLPAMIIMLSTFISLVSFLSEHQTALRYDYPTYVGLTAENGGEGRMTEERFNELKNTDIDDADVLKSALFRVLLWLVPCFAITGPFTAGLSVITRNWARDEHAFILSDFLEGIRKNWKQSLVLSVITSVLPLAVYVGWEFYGQMAGRSVFMMVPQVLVMLVGLIWAISITYMHPLAVTYQLKTRDVIRNGLLLGVARLPLSIGIRLLHCVPLVIGAAMIYFWNPLLGSLILFAYYMLIGFSLSRFITASYTNAVFDRFLNPRIEGAKVNQGLRNPDEEEDEEDAEEEGDASN